MHGQIHVTGELGLFQFLGEEALALELGEGNVVDAVAPRLDDRRLGFYTEIVQASGDVPGLPESEITAAGADTARG
jgi:hypothetical protein